jgi:hypothetical protein
VDFGQSSKHANKAHQAELSNSSTWSWIGISEMLMRMVWSQILLGHNLFEEQGILSPWFAMLLRAMTLWFRKNRASDKAVSNETCLDDRFESKLRWRFISASIFRCDWGICFCISGIFWAVASVSHRNARFAIEINSSKHIERFDSRNWKSFFSPWRSDTKYFWPF